MPFSIRRRSLLAAAGLTALGPFSGMPGLAKAEEAPIAGAGSSLLGGVMKRWIDQAAKAEGMNTIYAPIGSGGGISKVLAGEVDFGATDDPVEAATLANGNMIQFPIRFGGIVCAVNLPGISANQLRLTGELLGGIYAGAIKSWRDPKIAAVNPGLALPDLDIRPMTQGTSGMLSGTTYTFTQYLLATNADWRAKHGMAITKRWAVGSQVQTMDLMAENLKILPGGLGYVSISTTARDNLTPAMLINKAGKAVAANADSVAAAVARIDWTKTPDLVANPIDLPGDNVWPIVAPTYIVIPKASAGTARGEAVRRFFRYILANGGPGAAASQSSLVPAQTHGAIQTLMASKGV